MLLVDYLRIIAVLQRPLSVKSHDIFFHLLDQFIANAFVSQHIVGCHTSLSCIEELAPDDPARTQGEIRRFIYDARALAAQLQRYRSQVLRCFFHHQLSYRGATGKENIVKRLIQQILIDFASAFRHGYVFRGKVLRDDLLDDSRGCWRIIGWFDYCAVSRSDASCQRHQRQLQRIIPRCHDQNRSMRLTVDFAGGWKVHDRSPYPLRLHHPVEVFQHAADLF